MPRPSPAAVLAGAMFVIAGCSDRIDRQPGDLADRGGSPAIREAFDRAEDNLLTSNDESNDQPVGHFGTITVEVTNHDSGNTYTLDAEINGTILERVYFPKGGWVDFYSCELDGDLTGDCDDEEGRWWSVEGESSWSTSSWVDEEQEGAPWEDQDGDDPAYDDENAEQW